MMPGRIYNDPEFMMVLKNEINVIGFTFKYIFRRCVFYIMIRRHFIFIEIGRHGYYTSFWTHA